MAQKNATPTKQQREIIKKNGLLPYEWIVIRDLTHHMIIRNRHTNDVKLIDK